ncbi:hypothetical protein JST97_11895 [bacterium]|nr:hypothetical protein [bacterium]
MLGLVLCLQTLELIRIWPQVRKIWTLELVRRQTGWFPSDQAFHALLWLRLAASLGLLWSLSPWLVWILIGITLLSAIRFGGSLNGGSDYMTLVILSSLLLPWGRIYLAVQLTLSYVVAGLVKIRLPEWRNGKTLTLLTGLPAFLSLPMLLWECSFPLAWSSPRLLWLYLAVGVCFHLCNAKILGLNRFFWIWLAAYWRLITNFS